MRSEQLDVKLLLKQVYLAHTTKIKGLEDGIEDLKIKLVEAERKLKNNESSDCKRCAELEEAFKGCQAALHEQSKWFENLGQKFSVFDHAENKAEGNKISKDTNSTSKIQEGISDTMLSSFMPGKSSNVKPNLLKNLMSLSSEEYQDSLDLGTAPFPSHFAQDYSTLNSDSMILAPDTVDILSDIPSKSKAKNSSKDTERNDIEDNKRNNKAVVENIEKNKQLHNAAKIKECPLPNKTAKKRSLTGSAGSDSNSKKLHKSSVNESNCSPERKNCRPVSKSGVSESISFDVKSLKDKKSPSEDKSKEVKSSKKLVSEVSSSKSTDFNDTNPKIKNVPELFVEVCKIGRNNSHKSTESTKDFLASDVANSVKNTMHQVSPSLLSMNDKKDKNVPVNLLENEDIYDFQTPLVSKKQQVEEDSSWTACDKKKLKKSSLSLKLKSTSKFKMTLDALPPDYKKPTLRQTKLSKSIFLPKSNANACEEILTDSSASLPLTPKDNAGNAKSNGKNGTVDFDATCIPDNYEYLIIPSGSGIQGKVSHEESENNEDVILVNDESMDESSLLINENYVNKSTESRCTNNEKDTFEDFLQEGSKKLVCGITTNSFDRLPKKEEPNYKYKEETVRKKADRKQLNAFDCKECEKYYAELGLSDKEKQERMKQCSRHRSKFAPPATPEHFWELEFPDTQECKARGYMNETQKGKLKTHRRKPL